MNRLMGAAVLTLLLPSLLGAAQGSIYGGLAGTGAQIDLTAVGGGKDDMAEGGGTIGGQLLADLSKSVAVGIDLNYTKFGEKESSKLSSVSNATLNLKNTVLMGVVKWTAIPENKTRPYLLGGLGFHNSAFKYEAAPIAGLVWVNTGTTEKRVVVDDNKSALAGAFGVGLDFDINPSLFLGGEARFTYLGKVTWDATPLGQSAGLQSVEGDYSMFQLLFKLGFKFGSPAASPAQPTSAPPTPSAATPPVPAPPPAATPSKP